jgi:hypothetical protein
MASTHIGLEKRLIESKALKEASKRSKYAVLTVLHFQKRIKKVENKNAKRGRESRYRITNNGEIIFTYDEAKKLMGISRPTFANVIDILVESGLIDITHPGGGLMKDPSRYAISDRWRCFGTDKFIEKTRKKSFRGSGFTRENWERRTGRKKIKNNCK